MYKLNSVLISLSLLVSFNLSSQRLLQLLYDVHNGTSWDYSERTTYDYDTVNNRLNWTLMEEYNSTSSKWEVFLKDYHYYNASNQIINDSGKTYNSSTKKWEINQATTYTYNGKGLLINMTTADFAGTWDNRDKTEYTYNASDQLVKTETFRWVFGAWEPENRDSYNYNSKKLVSKMISEEYGFSKFDSTEITNYSYTSFDSLKSWETLEYQAGWKKSEKAEFMYNSSDLRTQGLIKEWNGSSYDNLEKTDISRSSSGNKKFWVTYDWFFGSWHNSWRMTFIYDSSSTPSSVALDDFKNEIKLFPNPVTSSLNISLRAELQSEITILSMDGTTVRPKSTIQDKPIDVSGLRSGYYILQIENQEGVSRKTFIKSD
ncbi:MAG: hypothetical protein CL840_07595 [Crocinitomicaceae bacterium]|nr:hypothetical protein [Crocinitomicaceae bacterium]|tara:strand:+ start:15756 stop:16877 length:1122 start_codon:yes stop_codon:yes gene_type:complete